MNDLSEVQPIDEYVRTLLGHAKKRYNLNIDLDRPTRGQRLEAALAMQDESNGHYSMEVMVGRRVSAGEPVAFVLLAQAMFPQDPRTFYEGFAHQYRSEEK